jgi:hypothetical protein
MPTTGHMSHMMTGHERGQMKWPAISTNQTYQCSFVTCSCCSKFSFLMSTIVSNLLSLSLSLWPCPSVYWFLLHKCFLPTFIMLIGSQILISMFCNKLQHGKIEIIWYLQISKACEVVECPSLDWCNLIRKQITTKYKIRFTILSFRV